MEFGKAIPHDIHITPVSNNGFIVKVGCCTCAFTDKKEMIAAIIEFIDKPEETEKRYNVSSGCDGPPPEGQIMATNVERGRAEIRSGGGSNRGVTEDCISEERSRR